jgi:hypothetical protein
MRVLLLDAAAGIGLLATITLSARRAPQKRSRHIRALGWMLVAGPLPLAVALHAAGRLPPTADQVAFLSAVAAFAIGAALVLSVDSAATRTTIRRRGGRSSSASSGPTRAGRPRGGGPTFDPDAQ